MKRPNSPWFKASLAVFSVSVVGAAIVAFSHASDVPSAHLTSSDGPIHSASQAAIMASSLLTSPLDIETTQEMILERTASCAEMISPKDKTRCLNKLQQMKREFLTQEKDKCDMLDAGKGPCLAELDNLKAGFRST